MDPVDAAEFMQVNAHVGSYPVITSLLSSEWLKTNILNQEDRFEKHPLFWHLLDESKCASLAHDLDIIAQDAQRTQLISRLKNCRDQDNFDSFRTELQVFAYYKQKETADFKVSFEPAVPGSKRKNDIMIRIRGEQYYVEIFTLLNDAIDRHNRDLGQRTRKEIDALESNPFVISFQLLSSFRVEDIPALISFIKAQIAQFCDEEGTEKEAMFVLDEIDKAEVWLIRDLGIDKGFAGAIMSEVRTLSNDRRIKNWILTKTEQMSEDTKNILVTNLLYPPMKFSDYYNGLIGQESLKIDKFAMEGIPFRKPNGAVYDSRTKKFGCFIVFERGMFDQRRKHLNPNAHKTMSEDVLDLL